MKETRTATFGFLRVVASSPEVIQGDIRTTADILIETAHRFAKSGCRLIAFPELSLAGGYTNGDLLHDSLLHKAVMENLERIKVSSNKIDSILVIGSPLMVGSALFNVAVVIDRGKIVGIVPKSYLPSGAEFYENRWFADAGKLTIQEIKLFGEMIPIGTDLIFCDRENSNVRLCIEICEDGWTAIPPSSYAAIAGATIAVNLSASNELVGKAEYRRSLVAQQSGRCIGTYVYCSSGIGESTTDLVFGGHCIIAENGTIIGESQILTGQETCAIADIDIDSCIHDRLRTPSFSQSSVLLRERPPYRHIEICLPTDIPDDLLRPNPHHPFVPSDDSKKDEICKSIFKIQSLGLAHRMKKSGSTKMILGLSGGLDSTLALLACMEVCRHMKWTPRNAILCYTMPGHGTSDQTRTSAFALAKAANVYIEEIPIRNGTEQILNDIKHDGQNEDVTFENAQARYRTLILMQQANKHQGLVVGTGDLSELALGWCTYNGDHMSHYNVNCSVPKTLVRYVVDWVARNHAEAPIFHALRQILETPISPELTSAKDGKVAQKTEEIIGPYELHDFFLHRMIRKGDTPKKIVYLAEKAFGGAYSKDEIVKWLKIFITRFFNNQFKRSAMPDGPKVGSVALSPRGDWRMPSDTTAKQWLNEL